MYFLGLYHYEGLLMPATVFLAELVEMDVVVLRGGIQPHWNMHHAEGNRPSVRYCHCVTPLFWC